MAHAGHAQQNGSPAFRGFDSFERSSSYQMIQTPLHGQPCLTTVKPCPSSDPPHLTSISLCCQNIRGLLLHVQGLAHNNAMRAVTRLCVTWVFRCVGSPCRATRLSGLGSLLSAILQERSAAATVPAYQPHITPTLATSEFTNGREGNIIISFACDQVAGV